MAAVADGAATGGGQGQAGDDVPGAGEPLALYVAGGPAGPEAARGRRAGDPGRRQDRHRPRPLHLQMGDRRAGPRRRPAPTARQPSALGGALTVPIMLVVAYGVGRILMNVFNNLRDALFAKVGQHAVRQLAYKTFVHMHELSLRYHLQRRTGGLSRVIERGVNGIETIVRFTILNTRPDGPRVRCSRRRSSPGSSTGPTSLVIAVTVVALCLVHGEGVRLAHQDPPDDERVRHGRPFQGDRLAPQLRDGQIFRQREDGGRAASTAPWRATSRRRSASGPRSPGSTSARR